MTPLCELAMKYGTDKCPHHKGLRPGHNYTPFYHQLFEPIREQVKLLVELGVETGASLRMWRDYFPNAQIIGIDCNANHMIEGEERITTLCLNVADAPKWAKLFEDIDVVIDDASHLPEHQLIAAQALMPRLAKTSFYLIEDVPTSSLQRVFDDAPFPAYLEEFNPDFPTDDDRIVVSLT
jgi:trans-aconitate methyltransferase